MEMREFTIGYAKKAKTRRNEEQKLQKQLNDLLSQSEHCKNNPLLRKKKHIQITQSRLKRIMEQKVKGAMVRGKARWVEHGEKKH